ncbi:hypothetical protein HU764_003225 [Pseudomonas sp. SWRI100]|uniref:hypothetical protein n=1 Tax=Pseudomonas TaxID=286 RepID=UPI0016491C46|nr:MULTISPECIES: hypothetical protein [Pseudomonas]MBC3497508.1 hypothetical protein [Pseudomonas sp. SWRI67]MBV4525113.1 hypothetical protein [Pseudomonas kermanshahensis]
MINSISESLKELLKLNIISKSIFEHCVNISEETTSFSKINHAFLYQIGARLAQEGDKEKSLTWKTLSLCQLTQEIILECNLLKAQTPPNYELDIDTQTSLRLPYFYSETEYPLSQLFDHLSAHTPDATIVSVLSGRYMEILHELITSSNMDFILKDIK